MLCHFFLRNQIRAKHRKANLRWIMIFLFIFGRRSSCSPTSRKNWMCYATGEPLPSAVASGQDTLKNPSCSPIPFIQHLFLVLLLCAKCNARHSSSSTRSSQLRGFPCKPNRCSISTEKSGPDLILDLNSEIMVVQHFVITQSQAPLGLTHRSGLGVKIFINYVIGYHHLPSHNTLSLQVRLSLENILLLMNSPCAWNEVKWPWREALLTVITMRGKETIGRIDATPKQGILNRKE